MAHKNDNNDSSFGGKRENFLRVLIPGGKLAQDRVNRQRWLRDGDGDDDGQYNCNKENIAYKKKPGPTLLDLNFWANKKYMIQTDS